MPFSLSQILSAASANSALLGPESAGFLVLQALENSGMQPLRLDARCVILAANGVVQTSAPEETTSMDADRRLRQLLQQALRCSGIEHCSLLRVAQAPARGLSQLRDELATALVPLNRGAARRALVRLHRRLEEAGSDIEDPRREMEWVTDTTDEVTAPGLPTFEPPPSSDEVTEPMLQPAPDATTGRFGPRSLSRFRARPSNVTQLLDEFANETFGSTLEVQDELRRVADASTELSRTPPPVAEASERPSETRRRNPKQAIIAGLMAIGAAAFVAGFHQGLSPASQLSEASEPACFGTVVVQTRPRAEVHLIEAQRTVAAAGPSAKFDAVGCDSPAEVVVRLDPSVHQSWIRLPLPQARLKWSNTSGNPLVLSVFEEHERAGFE